MQTTPRPDLPGCAVAFINLVVKKIRYRKKVRQEVRDELAAHFEDELRDCTDVEDRDRKAQQRIADFGNPKVLAALMRRAKKRCRPLWAKAVVHGLQALGLVVLYLILCALPLMIGRPTIRVNYLDWVNNLVRAGKDEVLNAKPYYDKAVELLAKAPDWPPELDSIPVPWPGDMNDLQRKAAAEFLGENAQALDALEEAAGTSSFWVHYELDPNFRDASQPGYLLASNRGSLTFSTSIVGHVMKDLTQYRELAGRMPLQSQWKAFSGDVQGAFHDALVLERFGTHLQGQGSLVEQLVGIAIEAVAHRNLLILLDKTHVPGPIARGVRRRIAECCSTERAVINFEVEKALLHEYVQRTFTDDGQGNGRVLKGGIPLVADGTWSTLTGFLLLSLPDRQAVTQRIDAFFDGFARFVDTPPSAPAFQEQADALRQLAQGNLFLKLEEPAFGRIAQLVWRLKTGREGLVALLGIIEYRQDQGDYPGALHEVVAAGYLDKLPVDPFSGGPLVYRRTDGGFLLYSVAENQSDDEGSLGTDSQGKPKMWSDNGDWVFWPVTD